MKQEAFFNRYHYNIDRDYLGGGGFGKVYKAFDDTLDRTVAIKVAEVRREQENVNLLKEVELAESIPKHRNIAHYQSCHRFKTPQGTFDYGVLQYYPEGNLSQLLDKKQLSAGQKEGIARGILEGLKHLHDHRIVHRDLKSSNILMARRPGGEYVPKIADFGLSKQFEEYDRSYFSNSFAGGSLLYVAPEQLTGQKIRKNADLWSLGVVLYELFVGEVPFYPRQSDIGTETGRAEIVRQINEASIPKEIEQVPESWRKVIESCLVTDAQQRVGSVEEIKKLLGEKPKEQVASEHTKVDKRTSEETVVEQEQQTTSAQTVETTERRSQISYWYILLGLILLAAGGIFWMNQPYGGGEELTVFEQDSLYGYQDEQGNEIIPAQFSMAASFVNQKAKVSKGDSIYYIDKKGSIVQMIQPDPGAIEKKKWQEARKINTIESYREYLRQFPEGEFTTEAHSRIEERTEWKKASTRHTIHSYIAYLKNYPKGSFSDEANEIIDELKDQSDDQVSQEIIEETQGKENNNRSNQQIQNYKDSKYVNEQKEDSNQKEINYNSKELEVFSRKGKKGYIDSQGEIVIPAKYDDASGFNEDLAKVELNDKYGYIDKRGETIVPLKYEEVYSFKEGLAPVNLKGKSGFVNKRGKVVVPIKYDFVDWFSEGLAAVELNSKMGFVDKQGEVIVPLKYDEAGWFSEGRAIVELWDEEEHEYKSGFIDKYGNKVTSIKYDDAGGFYEGLSYVKLNNKYGYIDRKGNIAIPIKFDGAGDFSEGLAAVTMDAKDGYITKSGQVVIPYKYYDAGVFMEGRARVVLAGDWGFIDKKGNEVVPLKYDYVSNFKKNGTARVEENGNHYFINKYGDCVKNCPE